jgi:hypothetical protein
MKSVLGTGFVYKCEATLPTGDVLIFDEHNLLPQVAIDHVAGLIRGTGSPISAWYMGIFEGNYVPANGTTSADLPTTAGECVAYSGASRPVWTNVYDASSVIDNAASRAVFTLNADKRIYGAFIVSSSTKGGGTGVLLSMARFAVPRDLPSGTEFAVTAGITLVPTA